MVIVLESIYLDGSVSLVVLVRALNAGNWDEIFSVRLFTNEVIMARFIYLVKSPLLFHAIGLLFRNEQVIVARCIYLVKSSLLFHGFFMVYQISKDGNILGNIMDF